MIFALMTSLLPMRQEVWMPVETTAYSRKYDGRRTASGERYSHTKRWTAASTSRGALGRFGRRAAIGEVWEVQYRGRTVTVRVNDTGSHRPHGAPLWLDLNGRSWADLTHSAPSRAIAKARRLR